MTELEEAMLARAGIPSLANAFNETLKYSRQQWTGKAKPWSCDAVFHAAFESQFLKQKNLSIEQKASLYGEKFYEACEIFARGGKLHKRPKYQCALTEVGRRSLAEIRATVGLRVPPSPPVKPAVPCKIYWTQKLNSNSELISDVWVSDNGYGLTILRVPSVRYAITRPGESVPFACTDDRRDVGALIIADMQGDERDEVGCSQRHANNNHEGSK